MAQSYFVTGTDTGVGKTWVTLAVMQYFKRKGETVIGMKPIAAGCIDYDGQLKNDDALLIQQQGSFLLDYRAINPYAYALAVSPHIAGIDNPVDLQVVKAEFNSLQRLADRVIVEGAGGWFSPLGRDVDNADLAKVLGLPVILVVAIRLGCINHARLTLQAIQQSGVVCAGWIAVCSDRNIQARQENIGFLTEILSVPLLGVLPYIEELDVDLLAALITFG